MTSFFSLTLVSIFTQANNPHFFWPISFIVYLAKGKRLTRQSSSVCKKDVTASPAGKGVFDNLRDLIDSEESESEKRERKTKKAVVLDSDSDESNEEKKMTANISDANISDASDAEGDEQFSSKKSPVNSDDLSSDEQETGNDVNGNEHDSETEGKDSYEERNDDSE